MLKSLGKDATNVELIEEKLFALYDEENEVKIRIGITKTKKFLVIQALYEDDIENSSFEFFQTKLTLKNLKEKSQEFNMESTMDGCYQIILNSFEREKVKIKDIAKMKYLKLTFNFEIKALDINLLYKNIDTSLIFQNFDVNPDKEEENNNNDNQNENSDNNNINEMEIEFNSKNNEEDKIDEDNKIEDKQDNNEYTQNEEDNNEKVIEINNINKEESERIYLEKKEEEDNNINDNIENQEYQDNNQEEQIIEKEEVFNEENNINEDKENNNDEIIKEEVEKKIIEVIDKENNPEGNEENNNSHNSETKEENYNNDINEKETNNDEENKEEIENKEKNIEFAEEKIEISRDIHFENNEIQIEKENNDIKNENLKEEEIIKEENKQSDDNNKENEDESSQKKIEIYNENEEEKNLKEKINELLEKINSLEKENGLLKKENSVLKEENKKIKSEKINLENEYNNVKKKEDSLRKENNNIKKENESLKKENNNLKKENKNLKSENDSFKNKLSRANLTEDKLRKSNREKNDLKIELQKLKNKTNKKDSPEKVINNKKKDIGDIIENIPKRTQTSNLVSGIDSLENIYEEIDNKEEENDNINKNEIINIIKSPNKNDFEKNLNFQSKSPINLKISKTLTDSSYIKFSIDNAFDAFTSLSGEILLIYATKFKSIECFDIIKQKYKKTILNAHNSMILIIRYYCPKHLNKEIILSSSNNPDYCVKIWDMENWSCIFNLNKIYEKGNMLSVCLHFDEYQKESYIFTSNDSGFIKIWGMDGQFIKNINKTENNETYFLDTYYDETELKYFLISGEMKCVKSFELNTHQLFRTYIDNNSFAEHLSAFVYKNMGVVELVECEFYGYIRIWNFHSGNLIKKIEICRRIPLVSMCLWNKNYLLVSCVDYTIKLVDFKNYAFIKSFKGHNNEVCTLKKIIHPMYGECLISQGLFNEQIKMWVND